MVTPEVMPGFIKIPILKNSSFKDAIIHFWNKSLIPGLVYYPSELLDGSKVPIRCDYELAKAEDLYKAVLYVSEVNRSNSNTVFYSLIKAFTSQLGLSYELFDNVIQKCQKGEMIVRIHFLQEQILN